MVPPGEGGALVIVGGGSIPNPIRQQFLDLAGGPKARIGGNPRGTAKRTLPDREAMSLGPWKDAGRPRSASCTPGPGRRPRTRRSPGRCSTPPASGWAGAPRPGWPDLRRYRGRTPAQGILDRGGVIGGTSAGEAIMSGVAIMGGRERSPSRAPGSTSCPAWSSISTFEAEPPQTAFDHPRSARRQDRPGDRRGHGPGRAAPPRLLGVMGDSYVVACVPQENGGPARMEILRPGDQVVLENLRDPDARVASGLDLDSILSNSSR